MAPADPPTSITLRIKVAPGHIADYADEYTLGTNVPTSANIGQVRHRIQQMVPTSPSPERQRLLYGGRALVDNEQSLADALNTKRDPTQTEYVIHLLVKGDGQSTVAPPHRRGLNTPERSASPAQTGAASGVATQQQQPVLPQHPGPNQPFPNHAQHVHIHHQPAHNGLQWRFPAQALHHAALPLPGQLPPGGFHGNLFGGQMPGAGPGVPHMGAYGQQAVAQGPGGAGAHDQQAVPTTEGTQEPQDPATANPPTATSDRQLPQPHNHQHGHPMGGPGVHFEGVGANGQRFTIHHQTLNMPALGFPGPGSPFGINIPGFGGQHPFNLPQVNPPMRPGPSALDQNRQNLSEAMDELDSLHRAESTTEEQRQHITRLRERMQRLGQYIDPFHLGPQAGARPGAPEASQTPSATQQLLNRLQARSPFSNPGPVPSTTGHPGLAPPPGPSHPTCYLLSSPTGPRAILYSPQHGVYTSGNATNPASQFPNIDHHPSPTPTTSSQAANPEPGADANDAAAAVAPAAAGGGGPQQFPAAAAAPPDPMGPLGPILAHFWLLLRVLIFTYFLLGSNMGWRRPLALLAVIVGFWLLRAGLFGDGGVLRRWWDGIVQVPNNNPAAPGEEGRQQQGQDGDVGENAGDAERDGDGAGNGNGNAGRVGPVRMPTPEEVARRLLDNEARERDAARRERANWLRERVRPVERAAALFVASLWPGVGEAHVRAREQEERRRAEEEVAARRREEEERRQREEREKEKESVQVQVEGEGEGRREGSPEEKASGEKSGEAAA